MNNALLRESLPEGFFSVADLHFGRFMARLAEEPSEELFLAATLLSHARRQGHVCLELETVAGGFLAHDAPGSPVIPCPALEHWVHTLNKARVVGNPGRYTPMILDDRSRLYLYRYWEYERALACEISTRAASETADLDMERLGEGLRRLFPREAPGEQDFQKLAAFMAVTRRFCVISGGPGTGKSTLISKILALLLDQAFGRRMKIALVAPTGKAAARMQEAVREGKERLALPESVRESMDPVASTIHRLLGTLPGSPYFRHDKDHPLEADVVVLDEASMVDLALMAKLVQSIPLASRLILLGDRDQLASVEAGAVLGDICAAREGFGYSRKIRRDYREVTGEEIPGDPTEVRAESPIRDSVVQLKKSYRFPANSGIGAVGRTVNQADGPSALALLKSRVHEDAFWRDLPAPERLAVELRETVIEAYGPYLACTDPLQALGALSRFRILCSVRRGPYGVLQMNRVVEHLLGEKKLIRPNTAWYPGRPVLVTENDYTLRLFNGDIGIILPDRSSVGDVSAFFLATSGELRRFPPTRLPEHETVFAMTVHKSQGTEFDRVLLMLPDSDSPVLTRELLYTGITRARRGVEVWGKDAVFLRGVQRKTERFSGLRDALWGRE